MALIYIVEDDRNISEIESYALKNAGYETKEFYCAKDFYEGVKEQIPDLFLLDIMLPDKDGLQIVKELKLDKKTNMQPIILVTAKTTEIDKVKGLDIGADDYMTKPFGVMELISRVKALLRRSGRTHSSPVLTFQNIKGLWSAEIPFWKKSGEQILKENPERWICISKLFVRSWVMRDLI